MSPENRTPQQQEHDRHHKQRAINDMVLIAGGADYHNDHLQITDEQLEELKSEYRLAIPETFPEDTASLVPVIGEKVLRLKSAGSIADVIVDKPTEDWESEIKNRETLHAMTRQVTDPYFQAFDNLVPGRPGSSKPFEKWGIFSSTKWHEEYSAGEVNGKPKLFGIRLMYEKRNNKSSLSHAHVEIEPDHRALAVTGGIKEHPDSDKEASLSIDMNNGVVGTISYHQESHRGTLAQAGLLAGLPRGIGNSNPGSYGASIYFDFQQDNPRLLIDAVHYTYRPTENDFVATSDAVVPENMPSTLTVDEYFDVLHKILRLFPFEEITLQ